jgi:raffinose/stachyose/melibiose transport system substrate-binding protein
MLAWPAAAQDPVEIKFWTLSNPGQGDFYAEAIAAFEAENPGIRVVHEEFPNEAYKTAIQVALNGSEPPDAFFNWVGEDSARLVREGLVMDITDYGTEETGFQSVLSPGWIDSLTYDGRIYGVAMEAVSKYFYYSEPFFAEHGLEVPETFRRAHSALPRHPCHRPGDRAAALGQFGALEAQPLHHHAQRARGRRRSRGG